jgi:hypothetical protein
MSVESLIEEFNGLVGKCYWTSARATHDAAVIDTLIKKGVDVSAIYNGKSISFLRPVALDTSRSKLVTI